MWRSEPQTPDASTFTTASSGAIGSGSGRPAVALLAQRVEHGHHVLGPDRAPPLDRPARVVQAELHPDVHLVRRLHDALADRERRLVHELAADPAEHEPRRVADPLVVEPERREEALDLLVAVA